jgi:hypothetical protein
MIIPKEKAEKLIHYYVKELLSAKYRINGIVINDLAKQCTLIAVDEILSMGIFSSSGDWEMTKPYWEEVKQEIEKL